MSENLNAGRKIRVKSGRYVDVFDFKLEDVDIFDIAYALARQCRFGGHINGYYSVAQHSVYTSKIVSLERALSALLHDASEAYILDIPKPIKPYLENYREIEDNIMKVIAKKYGTIYPLDEELHIADYTALQNEWDHLVIDDTKVLKPMSPDEAELLFLERFEELTGQHIIHSPKRETSFSLPFVVMGDDDAYMQIIGIITNEIKGGHIPRYEAVYWNRLLDNFIKLNKQKCAVVHWSDTDNPYRYRSGTLSAIPKIFAEANEMTPNRFFNVTLEDSSTW